jgi:hypothetical protein
VEGTKFFRKFKRKIIDKAFDDKSEKIFTLSSAYVTLQTKIGLRSVGKCGVCIKSIDGIHFAESIQNIKEFLDMSKTDFKLAYEIVRDSFGYMWIIVSASAIEDLLAAILAIGDTIVENGYSKQLLAAVFEFSADDRSDRCYLIYNYSRKNFYPFVPSSKESKTRNTEYELKIMGMISDELPFERDTSRWYPIWNMPI